MIFFTKNPNLNRKKNLGGGGGGVSVRGGAGVSEFFLI